MGSRPEPPPASPEPVGGMGVREETKAVSSCSILPKKNGGGGLPPQSVTVNYAALFAVLSFGWTAFLWPSPWCFIVRVKVLGKP